MAHNFRKEFTLSASLLLGTLLVLTAGFMWVRRDINSHNTAITQNRALIYRQSHVAEALAKLKQDAPFVKRYEKLIDNLLPTRDKLIEFRKFIDSISHLKQVGAAMQFQSTQVQPQAAAAGYAPFFLEATGGHSELVAFLKEIEVKNSRFIVDIGNVSIDPIGSGTYKVVTTGRGFFTEEKTTP